MGENDGMDVGQRQALPLEKGDEAMEALLFPASHVEEDTAVRVAEEIDVGRGGPLVPFLAADAYTVDLRHGLITLTRIACVLWSLGGV